MRYLTLEEIILIHNQQIKKRGGSAGIRSLELLESAVYRPQTSFGGEEKYNTVFEKCASLIHSLIKNHPFVDGNKRTGMVSGTLFLKSNGVTLKVSQIEYEEMALDIANNKVDVEKLAKWLENNSS